MSLIVLALPPSASITDTKPNKSEKAYLIEDFTLNSHTGTFPRVVTDFFYYNVTDSLAKNIKN